MVWFVGMIRQETHHVYNKHITFVTMYSYVYEGVFSCDDDLCKRGIRKP